MILEVSKEDYPKIYELGTILHPNYKVLYPLDNVLNNEVFKIIVYKEQGEVLGFLSYNDLKESIDILDVVVDEKFRRKHIASTLLDYIITGAIVGCEIFIEVDKNNISAISLYEKFGFEIIDIREKYYQDSDAYVMKRVIKNEK